MSKSISNTDCNYRIIKMDDNYYVDKKHYTFLFRKVYWIREMYMESCDGFTIKYSKYFVSLEDAEKYIINNKLENYEPKTVIKYL